jgi:protein-tyrosine kinase
MVAMNMDNNLSEIVSVSQLAEVKRIYSGIMHALPGSAGKVVVCSSTLPGEGKSLLTAAMAAAAAAHCQGMVLLIDFNWRAPSLNRYFGLETLSAQAVIDDMSACIHPSGIDRLDLLPAADADTSSPSLMVHCEQILEEAKQRYELVLVDTASIFPTNRYMIDPIIVARQSDGLVLVVMTHHTRRDLAKRAYMTLKTAGVNILGVVVNQFGNPLIKQ